LLLGPIAHATNKNLATKRHAGPLPTYYKTIHQQLCYYTYQCLKNAERSYNTLCSILLLRVIRKCSVQSILTAKQCSSLQHIIRLISHTVEKTTKMAHKNGNIDALRRLSNQTVFTKFTKTINAECTDGLSKHKLSPA